MHWQLPAINIHEQKRCIHSSWRLEGNMQQKPERLKLPDIGGEFVQ